MEGLEASGRIDPVMVQQGVSLSEGGMPVLGRCSNTYSWVERKNVVKVTPDVEDFLWKNKDVKYLNNFIDYFSQLY